MKDVKLDGKISVISTPQSAEEAERGWRDLT